MGVELASNRAVSYEMDDVDVSDSEVVSHVRDALRSVFQVSMLDSSVALNYCKASHDMMSWSEEPKLTLYVFC